MSSTHTAHDTSAPAPHRERGNPNVYDPARASSDPGQSTKLSLVTWKVSAVRRRIDGWLDEIAVRRPASPVRAADWILVGVLVALTMAEWLFLPYDNQYASALPAAVAFAALLRRRQLPLQAALAAHFAQLAASIVANAMGGIANTAYAHLVAGLILVYALCRWATLRAAAIGMAVIVVTVFVDGLLTKPFEATDALFLIPWLVLALLALAMRYRSRLVEHREMSIRLAERNALARDLHDTVAHHVSAIAVQAQAAKFAARANPEVAEQALGDVGDIANTVIDEMRRLVGILRSDDDESRTVAATSLAGFEDLDGRPHVAITNEVDLGGLPAPVAAAMYRIAQESVTNARRHSRNVTRIDVCLTTTDDAAMLEVVNDGTPGHRSGGGGYGVLGMTERANALDGTVESGARPGAAGWRVHATIPIRRTM